ncbi:uncharacterized protein N7458_009779 [Penicillium daleae]|uniref:Uncharacterized protein n=1 Tax=Penicillium daleae TaxID=63821 RepID=A0AAD6BXP5_9EURO|nr:uncharacterized protein N7458_009779 [Penicillium daleae]KAJ5438781.1 hypothetical protein N7458_009779 [Penicillium daleae]
MSKFRKSILLARSMVAKCWSKKGFQVLDYLSHGLIYLDTRGSPIKKNPGRYCVNFTPSSPQRNFKLAPT